MTSWHRFGIPTLLLIVCPLGNAYGEWPASLTLGDVDVSITTGSSAGLGNQVMVLNHPGTLTCGDTENSVVSDFNDDGIDEIVVSADGYVNGDGLKKGIAAVFLGRSTWSENLQLEDADLHIVNDVGTEGFPSSMGVVDINQDCVADLVLGYTNGSSEKGQIYIYYGSPSVDYADGAPLQVLASEADVILTGGTGYKVGSAVAGGYDLTGTGGSDLIVGATGASSGKGQVYLISFETPPNSGSQYSIDGLNPSSILGGASNVGFGERVYLGADVDGGGLPDVLLGAPRVTEGELNQVGEAYLVLGEDFGTQGGDLNISAAAFATFRGDQAGDQAGSYFAFLGDVTGNGLGALAVSAPFNDTRGADTGALYIIEGPIPSGLALLGEDSDVVLYGDTDGDKLGQVTGGFDLDGDGLADMAAGLPSHKDGSAGSVGLVALNFGDSANPWTPGGISLAQTILPGDSSNGKLGASLSMSGDIDGDGIADLLVGNPGYSIFTGRVLVLRSGLLSDGDGDGYSAFDGDCDDEDDTFHPGAPDILCDGIDQDCDGKDFADEDGDGFDGCGDVPPELFDCADEDNTIYPGAPEVCNGQDTDCDDLVDEGLQITVYADEDGDGYGTDEALLKCDVSGIFVEQSGDCDDEDANINPSIEDVCDGIDNDCDDLTDEGVSTTYYEDLDQDGYGAVSVEACEAPPSHVLEGGDCDDFEEQINPGAIEACFDGIDQDCTGAVSDRDLDGDSYVSSACTDYAGDFGGDCDDDNDAINPGAPEVCADGLDNDCSGAEDDVDLDGDGDGFTTALCGGTDCDDTNADINPDATEVCGDEVDNNCSGTADDLDVDGDGAVACGETPDCDDANHTIYPGAVEITCDGVDQDCDSLDSEDADGDGFSGCGEEPEDCNDTDAGINPDVKEVPCDGLDQDCDGRDFVDADEDGFSVCGDAPDCDDDDGSSYPGASDILCDGIDQNCDGADAEDGDGDSYSGCGTDPEDCNDNDAVISPDGTEIPYDGIDQDCFEGDLIDVDDDGFAAQEAGGTDCDDDNADIYMGANEVPENGVDDDCDQLVDEIDPSIDHDNDGFIESGDENNDCAPLNAAIYPGAEEVAGNELDDDCDGFTDEPDAEYGETEGSGCDCEDSGDGSPTPASTGLFLLSSLVIVLGRRRGRGW